MYYFICFACNNNLSSFNTMKHSKKYIKSVKLIYLMIGTYKVPVFIFYQHPYWCTYSCKQRFRIADVGKTYKQAIESFIEACELVMMSDEEYNQLKLEI